jgi:signal recognition particle GTPase
MYIPGVSASAEVVELKSMSTMLEAMTEAELEHPEAIRQPARERIATSAGKVTSAVVM